VPAALAAAGVSASTVGAAAPAAAGATGVAGLPGGRASTDIVAADAAGVTAVAAAAAGRAEGDEMQRVRLTRPPSSGMNTSCVASTAPVSPSATRTSVAGGAPAALPPLGVAAGRRVTLKERPPPPGGTPPPALSRSARASMKIGSCGRARL